MTDIGKSLGRTVKTNIILYSTDNQGRDGYITYIAGDCEYWIYQNGHGGIPIHKGNCRFCKERRQKELEELVIKLKEK